MFTFQAAQSAASTATRAGATWISKNPGTSTVVGTGLLTVAAPTLIVGPILAAIGFGTNGVIAGSAAAAAQSGIGNVVAGSWFAALQSAAAGGAASATLNGLAQGAGAVVTAGGVWASKVVQSVTNSKR